MYALRKRSGSSTKPVVVPDSPASSPGSSGDSQRDQEFEDSAEGQRVLKQSITLGKRRDRKKAAVAPKRKTSSASQGPEGPPKKSRTDARPSPPSTGPSTDLNAASASAAHTLVGASQDLRHQQNYPPTHSLDRRGSSSSAPPSTPQLTATALNLHVVLRDMRIEGTRDQSLQQQSQMILDSAILQLPTHAHRSALCLTLNRYSSFCASPAVDVPAFPITATKVALFLIRSTSTVIGKCLLEYFPQPSTYPIPVVAREMLLRTGGMTKMSNLGEEEGPAVTRELARSWTEALAYAQGSTRSIWDHYVQGGVHDLLGAAPVQEMLDCFLGEIALEHLVARGGVPMERERAIDFGQDTTTGRDERNQASTASDWRGQAGLSHTGPLYDTNYYSARPFHDAHVSQLHSTLPAGQQSRSQSLGNPELHHLVPSHLLTPGPRHSIALSPYGGGAGELPRPASGEHDHGDGALNFRAQSKEDARELQELERQLHGNFDTASGLLEHPASEPLAQATAATQDFYPTPMVGYQQGGENTPRADTHSFHSPTTSFDQQHSPGARQPRLPLEIQQRRPEEQRFAGVGGQAGAPLGGDEYYSGSMREESRYSAFFDSSTGRTLPPSHEMFHQTTPTYRQYLEDVVPHSHFGASSLSSEYPNAYGSHLASTHAAPDSLHGQRQHLQLLQAQNQARVQAIHQPLPRQSWSGQGSALAGWNGPTDDASPAPSHCTPTSTQGQSETVVGLGITLVEEQKPDVEGDAEEAGDKKGEQTSGPSF